MKLRDLIPQWMRPGARVESHPRVIVYGPPNPAVMAHYEAASHSFDRSWLPGYVSDARQDIDSSQRIELIRKSRYFEKNNGHYQKILDLIETNVVGKGITPTPTSSSPAYNKAALKWFKRWAKYADLTSRQTLESLEAIMARAEAVDGEIFIYLTFGDSGRPRLQLIEAHRVVSAHLPRNFRDEGYRDVDGILIDARGRPQFYIVGQDADIFSTQSPRTVALIPAAQIVHVFEPGRPGQYRGIPISFAVLHDMHDLDDLQRYEMQASKDAASRANVVYTESGEVPQAISPIGRSLVPQGAEAPDGERQTYYEKAFGAKTVALRRGDRWDQAENQRPSAAMREFWEYLENKICKGIGISYAAVCDYAVKWGGAALRGAVVADNAFYDIRTQSLAAALQRVWEHAVGWANDNGEIVDENGAVVPKPADWTEVDWQSPERGTVDIGYDSAAVINELRSGLTTYQEVYGRRGKDWEERIRQKSREARRIREIAQEDGNHPTDIAALDPNERAQAMAPKPVTESEKIAA